MARPGRPHSDGSSGFAGNARGLGSGPSHQAEHYQHQSEQRPQGTTVDVTVTGTNLNVVRSGVGSTSIGLDGSGIGLTFLPGRTDNRLPLRLVIAPNAPAGPRTITVRPPGSTSSAEWANATFTVLQAAAGPPAPRARPIISRIDPVAVGQGATTTITITGTNLKEPPGVAGDTNITLDDRGIRFFTEEHSATRIRLRLEIPAKR